MKKFYSIIVLLLWIYMFVSFSNGAKIYLESDNNQLISNCENNIDIMIDTEWEEVFGASVNMSYDRENIEILWFYLNDDFNLPLAINMSQDNGIWNIKSSELSLLRDINFNQKWFSDIVKYWTFVIKNKEPISSTEFEFLFDGLWSSLDNMDVFRLWDAVDVLSNVEWKTFNFVDWVCNHEAPNGSNQIDGNYNFQASLDKNLKNIEMLERRHTYKIFFEDYWVYGLMLLLLLLLMYVMRKKWVFKNKKILADKENKNV